MHEECVPTLIILAVTVYGICGKLNVFLSLLFNRRTEAFRPHKPLLEPGL